MQMKKRALALITAFVMVLMPVSGVTFAADMSDEMQAAYDALEIPNASDIRENVTLPETGENDAVITWASSDEAVISTAAAENENYDPTPAGVVTRGETDVDVTLTATLAIGSETAQKTFNLTVKAAAEEKELTKYVMYYFTSDSSTSAYGKGERIWVAASEDGLNWSTLNNGDPILESVLGERGLRDPYVIRSNEGDKFYLIATDLRVYSDEHNASGNAWYDAQVNGSKCIMVWESNDLVNWSDQRMVRVSTDDMGCTWAPEVTYDVETGEYVLYWASRIIGESIQQVYYSKTRDFHTFTEPQKFVSKDPYLELEDGETSTVIDTTVIATDDGYYRFTKSEGINRVFLEHSDRLLDEYTLVENNIYSDESGVEGPEVYRLNDGRYCVILDKYTSGGYFPYVTDDLSASEFTKLDSSEYSFPDSPRHGTVMRITDEEYAALLEAYSSEERTPAAQAEPDETGSDPIIVYDFENGVTDASGNGYDGGQGAYEIVYDEDLGSNVLSLDGVVGSYLPFPNGFFDGRNYLSVSMDINSAMSSGNFFTFTIGQNSSSYMFTKVNSAGVKAAITTTGYANEDIAEYSGDSTSFVGNWRNVTFTITPEKLTVYVDGELQASTELTKTIADLGENTKAYIGKSFFAADIYSEIKVDNVKVYNYALSSSEIAEMQLSDEELSRYSVTIDADEKGADITDGMFGLFFEDINYAADGGLYSEVINNRSFEAYSASDDLIPGYGWSGVGSAQAEYLYDSPLNQNNITYLHLTAAEAGDGILNDCYSGFNAREGAKYNASVYARGSYEGEIEMQILDSDSNVIGSASFGGLTEEFERYEFEIEATSASDAATVRLVLSEAGEVEMDMISLLPQETFNGRDNGLRADLVEMLAQLRPGFLRFPGGCIVEGYSLDNRYQWKHTVGPVWQRIQNWNRWQTHTSGDGRYGYCQTYGLGFYEYFLLCEDIGAKAVPVLNVGIGCQYQTGDYSSEDELYSIYIQDALDLIEFANGEPDEDWESIDYNSVDTTDSATFNDNWANLRALMGHVEAFDLEYIGIGNEQWNTSTYTSGEWASSGNNFYRRYEEFESAIHEAAPDMKLIATSGPSASGTYFENAWEWLKTHSDNGETDFTYAVDEHYYKTPDWFYNNVNRYDGYDRNGYGVFAGEYASRWSDGSSELGNTLETALSEAAYMTGLEKNSDIVKMASYAPLFAKIGSVQWTPDMIWFDNDSVYGSPDYYVQKLFSRNSGDYNLKNQVTDSLLSNEVGSGSGLGTWNTQATFSDFKITDNDTGEDITPDGWAELNTETAEQYEFTVTVSDEPEAESGNVKENLYDGDLSTRWTANGTDNWILCDLGEVKTVGKVGVATYNSSNGRYYYYEVEASADGENYVTLTDNNVDTDSDGEYDAVTNGYDVGDMVYTYAGNEEYRYIRINVKGNSYHGWNGVTEIEIYGECGQELTESGEFSPTGTWTMNEDGSLSQSSSVSGAYLFADGTLDTDNYTITVKATKTGGAEGFIIPFMASDNQNFYIWNVAGWSNTASAIQQCVDGSNTTVSDSVTTVLEDNVEYELKIVVSNGAITCYLDGEAINNYSLKRSVYSNAIYDSETGDIIVKLVNTGSVFRNVPLTINYSDALSGTATQYLLTGEELSDKNSVDAPENISIVRSEIDGISNEFVYELPAYSVAVLRIHTGNTVGVASIDTIEASTEKNTMPDLPETVVVNLADGTTEERAVVWNVPEYGVFANEGTFTVYGTVAATELEAVAIVTVSGEGDIDESDIIEFNAEALMSGEETTVYFNPAVSGAYVGLLAVYSDGALTDVHTVKFTAESGSMTVTLDASLENVTVKVMLWTDDTITPVTEAVTIEKAASETGTDEAAE